jgi:hypothetical protein
MSPMDERRVRLFTVDERTGSPISAVPLALWREWVTTDESDPPREVVQRRALGIYASDTAGYVSIPVPVELAGGRIVAVLLGQPSLEIDITEMGGGVVDAPAIPIPVPPEARPDVSTPPRLPSIIEPGPDDRIISPGSFASSATITLGEEGCEDLLISNVAERRFRFTQLVREPEPNPDALYAVQERANCEEDDPVTQEVTCWRRGVLLDYEMTWRPLGHALGEVIYSTALAPCESVNLAVIEWSRSDEATRVEDTGIAEQLQHNLRRDRAVEETIEGTLHEWQEGLSFISGGAYAGTFGQYGSGTASLGGGYFNSSGDRSVTADAVQRLSDGVSQAASAVRRLQSTVVVQATQVERDVVQTRTVTNHNHCHALTMLFYEVLRHYLVETKLAHKLDIILLKRNPIDFSSYEDLHRYRFALERALLRPELQDCLTVLDKKRAAEARFRRRRFSLEPPDYPMDHLTVRFHTGGQGPPRGRVKLSITTKVGRHDIPLMIEEPQLLVHHPEKLHGPWPHNELANITVEEEETLPGISPGAVNWYQAPVDSWMFAANSEDIGRFHPADRIRWDNVSAINIQLSDQGFSRDGDWEVEHLPEMWELSHIQVFTTYNGHHWVLIDDDSVRTFEPGDEEQIPVTSWGPREPEDLLSDHEIECLDMLLYHVQENRMHYSRAVWLTENPDERAVWLDSLTLRDLVETPRLLDLVENRVVGVLGDFIAMPALPLNRDGSMLDDDESSLADMIEEPDVRRTSVSLPTRGVFGEAELGACNACEERDPTRFWDWSESPCPPAPTIEGIVPGSRARDVSPTPSALPEPAVSTEKAPAAPDPGEMVGRVLDLLETPDIFRDMSHAEEVAGVLQKLIEGAVELEKMNAQLQVQKEQEQREQDGASTSDRRTNGRTLPQQRSASESERAAEDSNLIAAMERQRRISPEAAGEAQEEIAGRVARGGEGEETAAPRSTPGQRTPEPSRRRETQEVELIFNAYYDNGVPFEGAFEFNTIGPGEERTMFEMFVEPGLISRVMLDLSPGLWTFTGRVQRASLPDSLSESLAIDLPDPIPDISIPLSRHLGLYNTFNSFMHGGDFDVAPGDRQMHLEATAILRRRTFDWTINISSTPQAGVSTELQVSNEIKAGLEAGLRRLGNITVEERQGLAGPLDIILNGSFELGGSVSAEFKYRYVESIQTSEARA